MKVYCNDFNVFYKDDASPLTEADRRSHKVIESGLKELNEAIPIISEEGKEIPYKDRKGWNCFWLVDPLDGTKEFIKRNGEFTVNIALIKDRVTVVGIIYIPAKDTLYYSEKGRGAYKITKGSAPIRLKVREVYTQEKITVIESRSHPSQELEEYLKQFSKLERIYAGSSLKFCAVAEGVANLYPRLGAVWEWDTGAGHCIAEEAGAKVITPNGKKLLYNKESLKHDGFIISTIRE